MGRHPASGRIKAEDCVCLSLPLLRAIGMLNSGSSTTPYVLDERTECDFTFTLQCYPKHDGELVRQIVVAYEETGPLGKRENVVMGEYAVTSKPNPVAGFHTFLVCPTPGCGKTVRRLLLPPDGETFQCRICLNSEYRSRGRDYHEGGKRKENRSCRVGGVLGRARTGS